ncbi:MAG: hypothetical protein Q7R98_02620 [Candidatus Jorgensenbacteria bacterium]|nr:hypothetical protein [Candidatus Jorgensenbacteria bacterium]
MNLEKGRIEVLEWLSSLGEKKREVTNHDLWHWMVLTGDGQTPPPKNSDGGYEAFSANPWENNPWSESIMPGNAVSSGRILVCSSTIGFEKMGFAGVKPSSPVRQIPLKVSNACANAGFKFDGSNTWEFSRDVGLFWTRFYNCKQLFSGKEPMTLPAAIITDGVMRHYCPEGRYVDVWERLKEVADAYKIPLVLVVSS